MINGEPAGRQAGRLVASVTAKK